ncbi:MAG: hypothetical protein LUC30_01325 [Clostridiales bacterium]|nr:hypothetical protein [Clostridiales bacterium]
MIAGIPAIDVEDWTQGEITEQVQAYSERQRREGQQRSIVAARQAERTGLMFSGSGKKLPEVYETFPFWTEEEIKALQVEKVRNIMNRWAASGRKGGEQP